MLGGMKRNRLMAVITLLTLWSVQSSAADPAQLCCITGGGWVVSPPPVSAPPAVEQP